jgi:hypothetical protein
MEPGRANQLDTYPPIYKDLCTFDLKVNGKFHEMCTVYCSLKLELDYSLGNVFIVTDSME